MLAIFHFRNDCLAEYFVHILGALSDNTPQFIRYIHLYPMTKLSVEEHTVGNMNSIHFLQAHDLCRQLYLVHFIPFVAAMFVFYNDRLPSPRIFGMHNRAFKR